MTETYFDFVNYEWGSGEGKETGDLTKCFWPGVALVSKTDHYH